MIFAICAVVVLFGLALFVRWANKLPVPDTLGDKVRAELKKAQEESDKAWRESRQRRFEEALAIKEPGKRALALSYLDVEINGGGSDYL